MCPWSGLYICFAHSISCCCESIVSCPLSTVNGPTNPAGVDFTERGGGDFCVLWAVKHTPTIRRSVEVPAPPGTARSVTVCEQGCLHSAEADSTSPRSQKGAVKIRFERVCCSSHLSPVIICYALAFLAWVLRDFEFSLCLPVASSGVLGPQRQPSIGSTLRRTRLLSDAFKKCW